MHRYPFPVEDYPVDGYGGTWAKEPEQKIPWMNYTYDTPNNIPYVTPEKNLPGKWSINSDMAMIDLSHPWGNDQPTWPAGEQPWTTPVQYMSKFNRRTQLMHGFPQHVSTHYDAPAHVCQESPFVHEVPIEKFIGPAVIWSVPCTPMQTITTEMLQECHKKVPMQAGDFVIVVTGWHRLYSDSDRYFLWSPGLSEAAAEWLVEMGCAGFGIDCQALDHPCASYMAQHGPGPLVPRVLDVYQMFYPGRDPKKDHPYWEPVHEVFLKRNIPAFENVGGDVDKILNKRCVICAFPSRWYMGDGSIVRMIAFIDKKDVNPDIPDRTYKYGTY
jgi:kynurenine formamidase